MCGLHSGGIAGALSWLGIYHFDVIKTRLQSLPASSSAHKGDSVVTLGMMWGVAALLVRLDEPSCQSRTTFLRRPLPALQVVCHERYINH